MFCDIDKWVNQLESKNTGDIISTSYLDHILLYGICCMVFTNYSDQVNKTGTIYFICDLNICIVSTHQFNRFRKAICCILFVTFFLKQNISCSPPSICRGCFAFENRMFFSNFSIQKYLCWDVQCKPLPRTNSLHGYFICPVQILLENWIHV